MNEDRGRGRRAGPGGGPGNRRKFIARRKVCGFCTDKIRAADYKDIKRLQRYISDRGKILPRRRTGTCARHQRSLTTAIKRARHLALLPFAAAHTRS
jgi:small subunit ribosomal protein S18